MPLRHTVAATILQVLLLSVASGRGGEGRFAYLSPLPGSRFVPPGSSIAFRTGSRSGSPGDTGSVSVSARGAMSGIHPGLLLLSDDGRTFLFYPATPFTPGELVSVSIALPPFAGTRGDADTVRYSFTTSPVGFPDARRGPLSEFGEHLSPVRDRGGFPQAGSALPDSLPPGFPLISVNGSGAAPSMKIYLSDFPFDPLVKYTPFLMTVSPDGSAGFARKMNADCFDFKKHANGILTYHDTGLGYFLAMDSAFTVVDSFKCGNGYPTDVHELRLLPDGHALLLGYDPERVRMDTLVPGGDSAAIVYGTILQELDRSKNVVFQWRSWDHFAVTDAIGVDLTAPVVDYAHGNAVELDADGNFVVSSRHLSEITKIDRLTGEVIWRWGGKHNQFTFIGDSAGFSYQHMIRRLPDGHWTLFDNGNYHNPPYSRALEYALDEQQMTATLVWQFRHTPDLSSPAMGSVQRMDDGNTLIGWGATNPSVSLVAPGGNTLMELSLPEGLYSYRAFAALTPSLTLAVPAPASGPLTYSLGQNYPNPFNPVTSIAYRIPSAGHVVLGVYDVLGRRVATIVDGFQPPGSYTRTFDASRLSSGVYFCRLRAGAFASSKKMVLSR